MPVSMSNQQPQPFVLKPVDFLPAPIPALLQKTQIFAYRLPVNISPKGRITRS